MPEIKPKKKMGRPSKNVEPRQYSMHIRVSGTERTIIQKFCKKYGMTVVDGFLYAISSTEGSAQIQK